MIYRGIWIPNEVVQYCNGEEPFSVVVVWSMVIALQKMKGHCFASNAYFVKRTRFNERTIQNALRILEEKGLLKRTQLNGKRILKAKVPKGATIKDFGGKIIKKGVKKNHVLNNKRGESLSPPHERLSPQKIKKNSKSPIDIGPNGDSAKPIVKLITKSIYSNTVDPACAGSEISLTTQYFVDILEHKRKVKISRVKKQEWDVSIKKLITDKELTCSKFKGVLSWWKNNMGDKYTPRINSGKDLYNKWEQLCNARARKLNKPQPFPQFTNKKAPYVSIMPKGPHTDFIKTSEGIIKARLTSPDEEMKTSIIRGMEYYCNVGFPQGNKYVPVYSCIDELLQVHKEVKSWAAYWMDRVYEDSRRAVAGQWLFGDMMSNSSNFGETYGQFLREQEWMNNFSPEAIRPGGYLFTKFFNGYCEAKGIMKPC